MNDYNENRLARNLVQFEAEEAALTAHAHLDVQIELFLAFDWEQFNAEQDLNPISYDEII